MGFGWKKHVRLRRVACYGLQSLSEYMQRLGRATCFTSLHMWNMNSTFKPSAFGCVFLGPHKE